MSKIFQKFLYLCTNILLKKKSDVPIHDDCKMVSNSNKKIFFFSRIINLLENIILPIHFQKLCKFYQFFFMTCLVW